MSNMGIVKSILTRNLGDIMTKVYVVYTDQYEGYEINLITLDAEKARKERHCLRIKHPQDYIGIYVGELDKPFDDSLERDMCYRPAHGD